MMLYPITSNPPDVSLTILSMPTPSMPVIIDSAVIVKITMAKMKMLMPVLKCAFRG